LALARAGARAAHTCAAFSDASARQVWELLGRPCVTLPLGVVASDFAVREEPRTGPPRLLFAGFPGDPRKGVDRALAAMPAVLDVHPEARLWLPGTAADRRHAGAVDPRVLAATDDLGVLPMTAMPDLYRRATLSFLPSVHEALGISLVESLATGTPVVATRDGGMPSIVTDPRVGRLIDTDLASALLEVVDLAAEPGTAPACAEHALGWDWDAAVGPQHERLYASISRP
ncbi:MAG: glycosyl transferase group 1, partial [Frankiales bacterium]|nr:glycosyl transferase group 1 [Frankiales bacterium]